MIGKEEGTGDTSTLNPAPLGPPKNPSRNGYTPPTHRYNPKPIPQKENLSTISSGHPHSCLKTLKRATQEIERKVAIQLSILARCFELQDEFRVVELDHVLATVPENIEGHRLGVAEARQERRAGVLESTKRLMEQMDAAGGIANANILLHVRAARSVIDSLNSTAAIVDDFHAPLGIESSRDALSAPRWREALRDPQKLKKAGAEVGQKAAMIGGAAAVAVLGTVGTKKIPKGGA